MTLWDTIEHVQSPSAVLREVHRLLRPQGLVLLSTPNWNSLSRYVLGRRFPAIGPDDHIYYFNVASLKALLRKEGFEPVHIETQFLGAGLILRSTSGLATRIYGDRIVERLMNIVATYLGFGDQLLIHAQKV